VAIRSRKGNTRRRGAEPYDYGHVGRLVVRRTSAKTLRAVYTRANRTHAQRAWDFRQAADAFAASTKFCASIRGRLCTNIRGEASTVTAEGLP